jgi:hypothetical protein
MSSCLSTILAVDDKLECLSIANIPSLVKYIRVKVEPTQVEHLKDPPLR